VTRRAAAALLACAGCLLLGGGPSSAGAATSEEVASLAERAASDPRALAELLGVRDIDGRPVDMRVVLAGADEQERERRLAALAANVGAAGEAPADPATARDDAAAILGRTRAEAEPPIAQEDESEDSGGGLEVPTLGLSAPLLLALALAVIAAGAFGGRAIAHRRVVEASAAMTGDTKRPQPADLERRAAQAEQNGEYAAAVRLLFEHGLLRLRETGGVELPPPATARRAARRIGSARFEALAGDYEQIAFGGRPAGPEDTERAREGWRAVLAERGAR
jgi:hypothetical protein